MFLAQVLAVLALISAGVANSDSQFADVFAGGLANLLRARDGVISASGWIIFVAIAVLVIEGVILAIRFLNFGFVESYSTIVFIVVSLRSCSMYGIPLYYNLGTLSSYSHQ